MDRRACTRWVAMVAVVVLVASSAAAGERIFRVKDPQGDDYGDGSLIYPQVSDWQPGELDLVRFEAERVADGTELTVRFARKVRAPERRPLDGFVMLSDLARNGFYNLNVDVYVDMDRTPGSGRLAMLPGRQAEVSPEFAWEKAVCLTPRPPEARSLLQRIMVGEAKREIKREQGTVRNADLDVAREQIAVEVADDVFFPTRIKVAGSSISFFVPDSFLGGAAKAEWGYVVVVSGCDLMSGLQTADVSLGPVGMDFTGLMILGVKAGGSRYTFGSHEPDVEMLPPLVDVLLPETDAQKAALRTFDVLAGQRARIPGVVPAG